MHLSCCSAVHFGHSAFLCILDSPQDRAFCATGCVMLFLGSAINTTMESCPDTFSDLCYPNAVDIDNNAGGKECAHDHKRRMSKSTQGSMTKPAVL